MLSRLGEDDARTSIETFQSALEYRTFGLYQRYFDEAGFESWFSEAEQENVSSTP